MTRNAKRKLKLLAVMLAITILGGFVMTSCEIIDNVSNDVSETSSPINDDKDNIARGMPYAYSYIHNSPVKNDLQLSMLTDGDKEAAETITMKQFTTSRGDWSGTQRELKGYENEDEAYYHISLDLGFVSTVKKAILTFPDADESVMPKKVELFSSDDGYNFTKYIGEATKIDNGEVVFDYSGSEVNAKALRFYIYTPVATKNTISEIEVFGSRESELKLLSKGATYTWDGEERGGLTDDGKKLTDGEYTPNTDKTAAIAKKSSTKDDITKKNSEIIKIDLGEVKNVSQVITDALTRGGASSGMPEYLNVRYSVDGNTFEDFGQSYIATTAGNLVNSRSRYLITRNHTVKARYLLLTFPTTSILMLDEISVYGSDNEVKEPVYSSVAGEIYANTNVAAYREVKLNGKVDTTLTDMLFSKDSKSVVGTKENTFEFDASDIKDGVVSASVTLQKNKVLRAIFYGLDGGEYKEIESTFTTHTVGSLTTINMYFSQLKNSKYKLVINTEADAKFNEFQLFATQPQLPLIRGGFFQMPTGGGGNPSSFNSDYAWYLQLKGMKDLGMDYVVIQYSAHYLNKSTLINGSNIKALGYNYNPTYGSVDLPLAVLDAAEKLGMKVWLGTIHDADFNNIVSGKTHYPAIVEAGKAVIKDIDEMYGDHPAFAGYYLSDETCDQWLNSSGGVDAARTIYKGQSDFIHEIAPEKSVMIAPAIWRSGIPQKSADNLYKMLVSDTKGGRPVADIVAVQDCLGRDNNIIISDAVYDEFERYLDKWAVAIRKAGAEFWNDTEVFDVTSSPKTGDEVIKSLQLEAKYTNATIVFDIPHYFTTFPMHNYNIWNFITLTDATKIYTKFYTDYIALEARSDKTTAPESVLTPEATDVGGGNGDGDHLVKHETTAGKIAKTSTSPTFSSFESDFAVFAKSDTGFTPEYKMLWDNEKIYLLIKTNDTTASFGKGEWWSGKDDLLQIWLTADGSIQTSDALDSDYGIRYYLHRTGANSWTAGSEATDEINLSLDDAVVHETKGIDGKPCIMVSVTWNLLSRTAPVTGDKTAIGLKVQYIDGKSESWSSSDGTYDRSITSSAIFGFSE
ncbi:MAG: DUF4434 domain-containing protein [Eubacteriales bacterium]|nr:DUF4434 domain-containing protein [Eubacteriales bacterium]MDD4475891.1 DUF4434 domain-containing protein [Eubacteriales bacterium]